MDFRRSYHHPPWCTGTGLQRPNLPLPQERGLGCSFSSFPLRKSSENRSLGFPFRKRMQKIPKTKSEICFNRDLAQQRGFRAQLLPLNNPKMHHQTQLVAVAPTYCPLLLKTASGRDSTDPF